MSDPNVFKTWTWQAKLRYYRWRLFGTMHTNETRKFEAEKARRANGGKS